MENSLKHIKITLAALSVLWFVLATGLIILISENHTTANNAAKQSYAACVRSQKIGPPILEGYEKYRFLNKEQAKFYKETIPKSCHK